MKHLPRSTILLGLLLIGLVTTLLGFAVARHSPQGSVQTRVAHHLVADFHNHLGIPLDNAAALPAPGVLEALLLAAIALVAVALWRSWPTAAAEVAQPRCDRPRS